MNNQFENSWMMIKVKIQVVNLHNEQVRTIDADIPYFRATRSLILNQFFDEVFSRGIIPQKSQIFHIDLLNRVNVFLGIFPLSNQVLITYDGVINGIIQVGFKVAEAYDPGQERRAAQFDVIPENKPKKVKERKIIQAMEAVDYWRQLYQACDENGKRRYTLQQAARKVGIAKKTLDVYQIHIRAASELKFNLQGFKEHKVGVLRKYIRIGRQQGAQALQDKMREYMFDGDTDKYWINFEDA